MSRGIEVNTWERTAPRNSPARAWILWSFSSSLWLPLWLRWWRICLQLRRSEFDTWVSQEDRLVKETATTPLSMPREFQGWRSLEGYGPWGPKELDTTEWLTLSLFTDNKWRSQEFRRLLHRPYQVREEPKVGAGPPVLAAPPSPSPWF